MSETGFKCPNCGQTAEFTADSVVLFNAEVHISKHGWDYWTEGADVDFCDLTRLTCCECGHENYYADFIEEGK